MLKPAGTFLQATLLPPPPPSQLRARASHRRADRKRMSGCFVLIMIVVWERVRLSTQRNNHHTTPTRGNLKTQTEKLSTQYY